MTKSIIICSNIWLPLLLVLGLYGAISIKLVSGQEVVPTETTTLVPLAVESSSSVSPVPDTSSESSPVDGAAKPDESALVEPVVLGKPSQEPPPSSSNTDDKKPEDTDKSKDEKDNEDGGDDEEERIPKVYIIHHHGPGMMGPGNYRPSATPSNGFPPIPSRPSYFPSHSHHNHHHTHSQSSPFGSPFLSQSPIFQRNPSPVYIPSPFNGGDGGSWNPQMIPRRPLQNRPPLPQFQPPQPQQPPPSRFDPLGQFDDTEKKRQFYQDMLVTQLSYFKDKIEPMMDKEENITKKNDMEELLMTVQDLKQTLEHHQIFNISEIMDNWKRGKLDPVDQSNEESEVESSEGGGEDESNNPKTEKPNERPEDGDKMIQSESETSSTGKVSRIIGATEPRPRLASWDPQK